MVAGLIAIGLARAEIGAIDAARAAAAADAAALAALVGGPSAARELAQANGAELLRCEPCGDEAGVAQVEVVVGRVRRSARAERRLDGPSAPASGAPDTPVGDVQDQLGRTITPGAPETSSTGP